MRDIRPQEARNLLAQALRRLGGPMAYGDRMEQEDLPAGSISAWLNDVRGALRGDCPMTARATVTTPTPTGAVALARHR